MNEQLQAQLSQILALIYSAAKTSGDFAVAQLPEIAQTYLVYGRAMASLYLVLTTCGIATGLYVLLAKGVYSRAPNELGMWADSRVIACIVGGIGSLFSLIFFVYAIANFALVWFAPKVWLLKEFAGLLK